MRHDLLTIGDRLEHIRASSLERQSQREFADALGVPLRTYQTYEQDKREPDLRTLTALFEGGWNLNWVLTGQGPERMSAGSSRLGPVHGPNLDEEVLKSVIETVESALEMANAQISSKGKAKMIMAIYRHWEAEKLPAESVASAIRSIQEAIKSGIHE